MHDNRPIGIFDSGLGGLTVVAALRRALPGEDIIYLGDTARVPYGDKSPESIIRFAHEDAAFLAGQGVKLMIAACNTVSAHAMPALRANFADIPILGVLEAGVEAVCAENPENITIIGTRATISSDRYRQEIHAANPQIKVQSVPCPLFVPIIEEGLMDHDLCRMALDLYLGDLQLSQREIILLACTHYPLLRQQLAEFLTAEVKIIDSAEASAKFAENFLREKQLSAKGGTPESERFFVTDMPAAFFNQASRFLGRDLKHVEKIII